MAKVKLNPVIMQMRGQIGDLVFKRYEGGVIISRKSDLSDVKPNEAQLQHQNLFRQAALYGKLVMADPAQKADYEAAAKARGKPVFSLTVADFFNAPSVDEVDLSAYSGAIGDEIVVLAHDDFEVSGAQVSITYADGQPVEDGAAVETPAKSGRWVYTATAAATPGADVRIAVTVQDRPGGKGQATAEKSL